MNIAVLNKSINCVENYAVSYWRNSLNSLTYKSVHVHRRDAWWRFPVGNGTFIYRRRRTVCYNILSTADGGISRSQNNQFKSPRSKVQTVRSLLAYNGTTASVVYIYNHPTTKRQPRRLAHPPCVWLGVRWLARPPSAQTPPFV